MQPSGKSRFSAEGGDFSEQLQECLLQQVFRSGRITHHTQAKGVNAATVHLIQKFKGRGIPSLSEADSLRFGQRSSKLRTSLLLPLGWSSLGQQSNNGASKTSDARYPP